MKKSKKTSSVWKHFVLAEGNYAQCNHCPRKVSFKSGSTGNLARHLKKKHAEFATEFIKGSHPESEKDPDPSEDQIASASIVEPVATDQVFQTEVQCSHNTPMVIGYFEEVTAEENGRKNNVKHNTTQSNQDQKFITQRQKFQDERELFISTGEAVDMARKLNTSVSTKEEIFAKFIASELEDLKKNPILYTETKVAILDILRNSQLQLIQT